jgi:hypothetical protein
MRILYVEDEPLMAMCVTDKLEDLGHTVIHGYGWVNNSPIQMLGADLQYRNVITVNPGDFDAAIVDFKLKGDFEGWEIVGFLTRIIGKPCIGCSSLANFNAKLSEAGAVDTVDKMSLVRELPRLLMKLSEPLPPPNVYRRRRIR